VKQYETEVKMELKHVKKITKRDIFFVHIVVDLLRKSAIGEVISTAEQ